MHAVGTFGAARVATAKTRIGHVLASLFYVAWVVLASPAAYADFASSAEWFNAKSVKDRVVLQANLILVGEYVGLIDAVFGELTYGAIVGYQRSHRLDADGVLSDAEEATLLSDSATVYFRLGFSDETDDRSGIKVPIPTKVFSRHAPSRWGTHWANDENTIELETLAVPESETAFETLFDRLSRAGDRLVRYSFFKGSTFVLSGSVGERKFYTAFITSSGVSRGFSISWAKSADKVGAVVSTFLASMVEFPDAASASQSAPNTVSPDNPIPPPAASEDDDPKISAGTGIIISADGEILTNNHVAGECRQIKVRSTNGAFKQADLLHVDKANDLALIKIDARIKNEDVAKIRTSPPVRNGEPIAVYGFPLADMLSTSGNITAGNVSALAGLGDDVRFDQITAPIQPGNSGGPLLDESANVIGIIQSKLDEIRLEKSTGDFPQNVNFAIKSSVVTSFLEAHHVGYDGASRVEKLDLPTVADIARRFTVFIICANEAPAVAANPDPSQVRISPPGSEPNGGAPATGRETYRVSDIAVDDVLNMRSGPGTEFPITAPIPSNGRGIAVSYCQTVSGYGSPWCRASWQGNDGWASACCLVSERTGLPAE